MCACMGVDLPICSHLVWPHSSGGLYRQFPLATRVASGDTILSTNIDTSSSPSGFFPLPRPPLHFSSLSIISMALSFVDIPIIPFSPPRERPFSKMYVLVPPLAIFCRIPVSFRLVPTTRGPLTRSTATTLAAASSFKRPRKRPAVVLCLTTESLPVNQFCVDCPIITNSSSTTPAMAFASAASLTRASFPEIHLVFTQPFYKSSTAPTSLPSTGTQLSFFCISAASSTSTSSKCLPSNTAPPSSPLSSTTIADLTAFIDIAIPCRLLSPPVSTRDVSASATAASRASVLALLVNDLDNWSSLSEWEQRLESEYVGRSCGTGRLLTVVPVKIQNYNSTGGSFIRARLSATGETLPFFSVFQYAFDFNDCLDVLRIVLAGNYMGLTLRCWTVIPFVSPHPAQRFVDGRTKADVEWRGVAVVASTRILLSF